MSDHSYIHQARENFLEAMEIPLLAGRSLNAGCVARVANPRFFRIRHRAGKQPAPHIYFTLKIPAKR